MQSLSITRNGSDALTVMGTTVGRFLINFKLGTGTVATTTLQNCVLTVQLTREGEAGETILSGGLDVLPFVTGVSTGEVNNYSATVRGFVIDLPQAINLTGQDRLNVRIQSGAIFQTSAPAEIDYTCNLTVCGATGIENWTPVLRIFQVPSGQTNFSQSFGDFVRYITVIQPIDKVIQLQVESSFFNDQFIKEDLQCLICDQYSYSNQTGNLLTPKSGNVVIYGDKHLNSFPLNGVRVMGTIDTNVSGSTYIVCWCGSTNQTVKSKAIRLKDRITSQTAQNIPSAV
jgi:hypothetical protein